MAIVVFPGVSALVIDKAVEEVPRRPVITQNVVFHSVSPFMRKSWMLFAALRPAPIAWMTVAAPVTMSPPAKTPLLPGAAVLVGKDIAAPG